MERIERTGPPSRGAGSFATGVGRAARLRCPNCGRGRVVESWFRMRERCSACGIRVARHEDDFFMGAMMFNLVFSEGVLALLLVGLAVVTWPDVPWTFLQYGGIALMAAAPFFFLPFSRTVWMAVDLMLHPPTDEELAEGRRVVAEKES